MSAIVAKKAPGRNVQGPPLPNPTRSLGRGAGGGVRLAKRDEAEHIYSAKRSVSRSLERVPIELRKIPE